MPHFFNDILSLNCSGIFRSTDSYKVKRRKIQKSVLLPTQLCNTHSHTDLESEWCTVPSPDYGCSGLPCTDMSRAGYGMKKHGPTNSVYMTHGKFVERKKVPIFTVECTPESRLIRSEFSEFNFSCQQNYSHNFQFLFFFPRFYYPNLRRCPELPP